MEAIDKELEQEIERRLNAAVLALPVEERLNRGTVRVFRPGIDDGPRGMAFETMEDYRRWCETLPRWLGYHRVT